MPQTRFVLGKALEAGLKPVVVVNKCDRPDARPDAVVDGVFDLLAELGADDAALDFPVVYASAKNGWASFDWREPTTNMRAAFSAIIEHVPAARYDASGPLQLMVTTLDSNEFVGRIGIGRVERGVVKRGQRVALLKRDGSRADAKVVGLQRYVGLKRVDVDEVAAGDIAALVGVEGIDIGDTTADPERPEALPGVTIDEPTITMVFRVNDSPMAGQEGKYVTSRQIRARLNRELERDVALRVEDGSEGEFVVSGRGLLHIGILLENMRREAYELAVGKPRVILREIDGRVCEPFERVIVDTPEAHVGSVIDLMGRRGGEMRHMDQLGATTRLEFRAPSRGLIGLRTRLLTATQGEGVLSHVLDGYEPTDGAEMGRGRGVLIASEGGQVTAHAVEALADRGMLFVKPGDKVYGGQIVGEHNRDNDLTVNIVREKKLDNIRSSTKEATVTLKASRTLSLEDALEYVESDEVVEITPGSVRMRKRELNESMRKKAEREARSRQAS
jgi:GTP-binding protein